MSDLAARIRSEASIADRPGQMSRLEAIAAEVDRIEALAETAKRTTHGRLGLADDIRRVLRGTP